MSDTEPKPVEHEDDTYDPINEDDVPDFEAEHSEEPEDVS